MPSILRVPRPAPRRPGAHPALAAILALALALAFPSSAAAHTRLQASAPSAGDTVADTLREIRLTFSTPVTASMTALVLRTGETTVAEGALVSVDGGGRTFAFRLPHPLAPGDYTAAWRSAAADGHVIHGTLAFSVRAAASTSAAEIAGATPLVQADAAPPASPDESAADGGDAGDDGGEMDAVAPLPLAVRWLEFLSLLGMVGAVSFNLLVVRRLGPEVSEPVTDRAAYGAWHVALGAAALGALTLAARLWLQSRAVFGADEAFDGGHLDALVRGTVWGSGWILQAVATVAYVVGLTVARAPHGRSVGWMGAAVAALLLAAVPALSGHAAATERMTAVAIVSDWLHVLGAGVWLGTLAMVLLAGLPAAAFAGAGKGVEAFARMVRVFSPVALAGAGTAGVTGVVNSLFHFTAPSQLWTSLYGRALLIKLGFLAVVAVLGWVNWRRILPRADTPEGMRALRRNAVAELANGVIVILVTAALVALPPP
jgi:copper transport protein